MTEEQITALLSHLENIEKSFISELSHVKADLMAARGNVAITPERQTKKNKKAVEREEKKARIIASYK